MLIRSLAALLLMSVWFASAFAADATIDMPAETLRDKIRGGLLGQILGNLNGIPHEMKYIDEAGSVTEYTPALPEGARTDDDTDFEWVYIIAMQRENEIFLPSDRIVPDMMDWTTAYSNRPLPEGFTLITGPSKTADIELKLVVGVHGPSSLHVIITG